MAAGLLLLAAPALVRAAPMKAVEPTETPHEAAPVAPPAPGPASVPASQPVLAAGMAESQPARTVQPGEIDYKSPAVGAAWSFGATLLPVIIGGFAARAQSQVTVWLGFGLIVAGQSFGPAAGFWYAGEKARFTWHRLGLTLAAFGAGVYPLYAYTGRFEDYNHGLAAALTIVAVIGEAAALSLAAWDLSLLGETIERHNDRPSTTSHLWSLQRVSVTPLLVPGGGGLGLGGRF